MSYYCDVYLALCKEDYDELFEKAKAEIIEPSVLRSFVSARHIETPDDLYELVFFSNWKWNDYHCTAVRLVKEFIKDKRHSLIVIGEDNYTETEVVIEDDRGCDEEFYEILELHPKVYIFGEEVA